MNVEGWDPAWGPEPGPRRRRRKFVNRFPETIEGPVRAATSDYYKPLPDVIHDVACRTEGCPNAGERWRLLGPVPEHFLCAKCGAVMRAVKGET